MILFLLTSCVPFGHRSRLHFDYRETIHEEVIPDEVSFKYLKKKILKPHCISCHKEMGDEKKLLYWIVKGNAEESDLFFTMEDGSMPPKRAATTYELEVVRRYIEQMKPAKKKSNKQTL